jgi:hypothetical protein
MFTSTDYGRGNIIMGHEALLTGEQPELHKIEKHFQSGIVRSGDIDLFSYTQFNPSNLGIEQFKYMLLGMRQPSTFGPVYPVRFRIPDIEEIAERFENTNPTLFIEPGVCTPETYLARGYLADGIKVDFISEVAVAVIHEKAKGNNGVK